MWLQPIFGIWTVCVIILSVPYSQTAPALDEISHDIDDDFPDWRIVTKDEVHSRDKRAIFALVVAAAPIASAIFGGASFTYGVINGQQRLEELRKINQKLDELDRKIDSIGEDVKSLQVGQEWLEGAILYGNDVQRLTFLLDYLTNRISLQNDKSLGPASTADAWADAVLDLGADGISQVLHNFHDMVVGSTHIFGRKPLFLVHEAKLVKDSSTYWMDVRRIVDFMYLVQLSGYAAWATALNIKGRQSEVSGIQQIGRERMAAQENVMNPLTLEWPTGNYGLPKTSDGCPVAAAVQWNEGWRKHDTEDDDSNNQWTNGIHFPGGYGKNNMNQYFCMKTGSGGSGNWPSGNYCIFKKNNCPSGFSFGNLKWDDEDDDNSNAAGGHLPNGVYNRNTIVEYCCRSDGSANSAITLPTRQPFYLFRFNSGCQKVNNRNVREEFFRWDDEDDDNGNSKSGSHPYDDGGSSNHKLHYCYYY